MKIKTLEYHKISKNQAIDSAMLIFHGYGDSYEGFVDFANYLKQSNPKMGFFLINGPKPLMFGGYSWFDLTQEDFIAFEDITSGIRTLKELVDRVPISEVHKTIEDIVAREGLSYDKVFLAGFSQGGLVSLASGLSFKEELAGIIAMSSVPLVFEGDSFCIRNTPPVLLTHSQQDSIVPFLCFHLNKEVLKSQGIEVTELELAKVDHNESINDKVMAKIDNFIKK